MNIDLDAITQKLDELKDYQAKLKFELKNTEDEIEKQELKLIALIDQKEVDSMDWGVYTFGWKYKKRKAFDQGLFSKENPELFDKYKIEKESKSFVFKINK